MYYLIADDESQFGIIVGASLQQSRNYLEMIIIVEVAVKMILYKLLYGTVLQDVVPDSRFECFLRHPHIGYLLVAKDEVWYANVSAQALGKTIAAYARQLVIGAVDFHTAVMILVYESFDFLAHNIPYR